MTTKMTEICFKLQKLEKQSNYGKRFIAVVKKVLKDGENAVFRVQFSGGFTKGVFNKEKILEILAEFVKIYEWYGGNLFKSLFMFVFDFVLTIIPIQRICLQKLLSETTGE